MRLQDQLGLGALLRLQDLPAASPRCCEAFRERMWSDWQRWRVRNKINKIDCQDKNK